MSLYSKQNEKAFIEIMGALELELKERRNIQLPQEGMVVIDIGTGPMPYARAYQIWAGQTSKRARIIAVEQRYTAGNMPAFIHAIAPQVEPVGGRVEDAYDVLKAKGIEHAHLLTMFNPSPTEPIPNIKALQEIVEETPVAGAFGDAGDADIKRFTRELNEQGYEVATFMNPVLPFLPEIFGYDYRILFVAMPQLFKAEKLNKG